LVVSEKLNERDFGSFDGMTYDELRTARGLQNAEVGALTTEWTDVDGVESDEEVLNRVMPEIRNALRPGIVCVVTSSNVIHTILRRTDIGSAKAPKHIPTGSFVECDILRTGELSNPRLHA